MVGIVEGIAKALSQSDTFVSRNIEFYKNNKERKLFLDESIKTVMLAKNKDTLSETANNITNHLFAGREYLSKEEFLHQVQSKQVDPTLTIYLLLLRSEFMLLQDRQYQQHLTTRT